MRFGTQVRVWDLAIFEKVRCGGTRRLKNYLKYFYLYFLYIFTIKILLKNTLLSLIHKTKKEEGKIGPFYPLRWEFLLFRPDSRPILACFGYFGRRLIRLDSGRISPVRRKSKPNRCELSRVSANLEGKKKKKKKLRRGTDTWATTSDAASRIGLRCGTLPTTSVLSNLSCDIFYTHYL